MRLIDCISTSNGAHMFHRYEIEVSIDFSPEGDMMAILLSQSAHATAKRMQSRPRLSA